jgi:transposase
VDLFARVEVWAEGQHSPRRDNIEISKNGRPDDLSGTTQAQTSIQKAAFRRDTLLQFFARAEPVLVGMEACPGSQWLARRISALGHRVRINPAQFVKPYVKSNKNDIIDAGAIA